MSNTTAYGPFAPTASPANGFAMFAAPASPRDTHFMYDELNSALRSQHESRAHRRRSANVKEGLKKLFGGQ